MNSELHATFSLAADYNSPQETTSYSHIATVLHTSIQLHAATSRSDEPSAMASFLDLPLNLKNQVCD